MITAAAAAAAGQWRTVRARAAAGCPPPLPGAQLPRAGERLLVFAPHPDDESLAVGGLLSEAARRGAEAHVVYLTSGDGFPLCAAALYRRWPGPAALRRLARERREEARRALAHLGVPASRAVFLGYPDRGLAALWTDRWHAARPYRSPVTGAASVPRDGGLRPGSPYCGAALLSDLETLLRRLRPDAVYYPDPADDHPDHWAASCFARLALERTGQDAPRGRPRERSFLVHRGFWPEPLEPGPDLHMSPPAELRLLEARWESLPLPDAAVADKTRAIRSHRSQNLLAGNFLSAFIRRNELLSRWPVLALPGRSPHAPPAGLFAGPAPAPLRLEDPLRDRWGRARWGAADFAALEARRDGETLVLRARVRSRPSRLPAYRLYWKPVRGDAASLWTRSQAPGSAGSGMEVRIPARELRGAGALMIAAAVAQGPLVLDRTPWRVVSLAAAEPEIE